MTRVVLTITGPSASGKSTLERLMCDKPGSGFHRIVSTTTRPPRKGEVDGDAYYFVSQEEFDALEDAGEFVENNRFGAHSYAANLSEFRRAFDARKIAVVILDPNGRAQLLRSARQLGWNVVSVFITNPPSIRMRRLIDRFVKDIESLALDGEQFQKQCDRFADRLAITAHVESRWGSDLEAPYHVYIDQFDETNTERVLATVTGAAIQALSQSLSTKTEQKTA
jgi:guanylate kinase